MRKSSQSFSQSWLSTILVGYVFYLLPKVKLCVKFCHIGDASFLSNESGATKNAQQSVHLTLGILRTSQAVFYALSFFQSDGFAVPRPSAGNANRWAFEYKARQQVI
jgi:RIO-like serine/threonine protein kinase